jgi:hypothetical protein
MVCTFVSLWRSPVEVLVFVDIATSVTHRATKISSFADILQYTTSQLFFDGSGKMEIMVHGRYPIE